jgi:hypothetical protein
VTPSARPLAVRLLRGAGWAALGVGGVSLGIGALLGFDELARIWAVIAGILLAAAAAALGGARPGRAGCASALVACALLLLLPPVGTLVVVFIALVASQTWPEVRAYYRIRGRAT